MLTYFVTGSNKFGSLCSLISSHVDILSIAETKLDYSFIPNA